MCFVEVEEEHESVGVTFIKLFELHHMVSVIKLKLKYIKGGKRLENIKCDNQTTQICCLGSRIKE
jgi:hypothetical protein